MGISSALGSSALLPAGLGFRNKIINGAMVIAQRGTSAITGSGSDQFPVDRWGGVNSVGTVTFQQSSTAPAGFSNSVVATVTATGSYSTSGYTSFFQRIEGYNVADCAFGTSSAKQMTLSFWVRSSVTGDYSVAFVNGSDNRFLWRKYTVNAANTWEYKTVQFVGDTTGTWATGNTTALAISFQLGRGTAFDGPENAWSSSPYISGSGCVDFAANSGATFYLTGVQLEANYQPTPFEQRPIGVELQLCQRYYYKSTHTPGVQVGVGMIYTTNQAITVNRFPVPMRIAPTTATIAGLTAGIDSGGTGRGFAASAYNLATTEDVSLVHTGGFNFTNGAACYVYAQTGGWNYAVSAEL